MGRSKVAPDMAVSLGRKIAALELRKEGLTYKEIAERLGVAPTTARDYVRKYFEAQRAHADEKGAEVFELELARLDALLRGVWAAAVSGDVQAVDRCLRIMERRSKYLGLDAPEALDIRAGVVHASTNDMSNLSTQELNMMRLLHQKAKTDDE